MLLVLHKDGAACEKNRLEEKQRAARKQRGGDSSWKPRFEHFTIEHCVTWMFTDLKAN